MDEINKTFGERLRVRSCGILIQDEKVLMVKHRYPSTLGYFWAPPGGGVNFGETTKEALIREYKEETGLDITVQRFMFVHEFLKPPLHGIELFFEVTCLKEAQLLTGTDPEMAPGQQIIEQVTFLSFEEIKQLPKEGVHQLFQFCETLEELQQLHGLYT
ncbi:NUDIX domain-containing protein [Algivirga pacifica]|uniref:NUDIX hydrolase n=1 Tax=Algivirga pacifica TaxID=1162670 RepID=A0ABP9DLB1_9BACT